MEIHVAQSLFNAIDSSLQTTLASGTSAVMAGLGAAFGSMWLIHFTLKNIYWLFSGLDGLFQDIVFTMLKMAMIVYFAFNVSWYISAVVPFVTDLPTWMGGVLSGQNGAQTNQVDTVISTFVTAVWNLVQAMHFSVWEDADVIVLGVLALVFMLLGGVPFLLVCVGTLITLKASTTLFLIVGPVFIAFALFDQTKQWFWGWISVVGGFMLANVLFSVVIALEIAFINTVVLKNGQIETTFADTFAILFYFGAFTMLATELPSYAATVMGGAAGSTNSVGNLLTKGTGLNAARNMASAAYRQFSKRRRNTIKG